MSFKKALRMNSYVDFHFANRIALSLVHLFQKGKVNGLVALTLTNYARENSLSSTHVTIDSEDLDSSSREVEKLSDLLYS